jgi:hypothetical protein
VCCDGGAGDSGAGDHTVVAADPARAVSGEHEAATAAGVMACTDALMSAIVLAGPQRDTAVVDGAQPSVDTDAVTDCVMAEQRWATDDTLDLDGNGSTASYGQWCTVPRWQGERQMGPAMTAVERLTMVDAMDAEAIPLQPISRLDHKRMKTTEGRCPLCGGRACAPRAEWFTNDVSWTQACCTELSFGNRQAHLQ